MSTLNCILYVRKSRSVEGNTIEEDLEKQRGTLLAIADSKGYNVLEVFEEVASSVDAERKQFNNMIELIEKGGIDVVIISAIDRVARSLGIFEKFLEICKDYGILIETPREQIDLSHDGSELLALIQSVLAKSEYGQIKRRLTEGKIEAVRLKGRWIGTGAPYGYQYNKDTKTLTPNEDTLHVFRRMVDMSLEGNSYAQIADKLNELGHRSRTGKVWTSGRIQKILKNRVNLGETIYNSSTMKINARSVGSHEPIMTNDEFNMIAKLSLDRRTYGDRASNGVAKTIIDNLVFCSKCKRKVSIFLQTSTPSRNRKTDSYMARTCIHVDSMTGIKCDNGGCKTDYIEEALLSFLSKYQKELENEILDVQENGSDSSLDILRDKAKRLENELSKNEEGIKRLTDAYIGQVMDLDEFAKRKNDLLKTKIALERDLDETKNQLDALDVTAISERLQDRAKIVDDILNNANDSVEELNKSIRLIVKRIEFEKVKGVAGAPHEINVFLHNII